MLFDSSIHHDIIQIGRKADNANTKKGVGRVNRFPFYFVSKDGQIDDASILRMHTIAPHYVNLS